MYRLPYVGKRIVPGTLWRCKVIKKICHTFEGVYMNQKKISRSKEDYLKAVYVAIKKHGSCRNMDVSKYLGVSKSSACIALKKLEQEGFVVKDDWRILLTDKGQEIGCKLYEKDNFFADWFMEIGVSEAVALKDACRIEHAISEETYSKIRTYLDKTEKRQAVAT